MRRSQCSLMNNTYLVICQEIQPAHDLNVVLSRHSCIVLQHLFRAVRIPRPLNGRTHERINLRYTHRNDVSLVYELQCEKKQKQRMKEKHSSDRVQWNGSKSRTGYYEQNLRMSQRGLLRRRPGPVLSLEPAKSVCMRSSPK